ncbi:MAG: methyltransferase RsmF C-terminal domain-like protein [Bacteroidota bacterium]
MPSSLLHIIQSLAPLLDEKERSLLEVALQQPPVVSVRLNPAKPFVHHFTENVPWCRHGFYLEERPVFTLDPLLHAGAYYVQEASGMILQTVLEQVLLPEKQYNVLDLCAAPGGKSTLISSCLPPGSLLVANEVIRNRAMVLKENIIKWGNSNTIVTSNEAKDFQSLPHFFDVIVADVPCSGEGLIRKDENALNEWSQENVLMCSARQKKILDDVWPALKPGGIFIYCTCTFNTRENEENISWLSENKNARGINIAVHPSWNITETATNGIKGFHFFPHKTKGEGFFITVVQKPEEEIRTLRKPKKNFFQPLPAVIKKEIQQWVKSPEEKKFILHNSAVGCIDEVMYERTEQVVQHLKPVYSFLPVAEIKGKDFIPSHELALSAQCNTEFFSSVTVEKAEALKFLAKEEWNPQADNGWHLIRFSNQNLGWIKKIGARTNNYYPPEWRIKMNIR